MSISNYDLEVSNLDGTPANFYLLQLDSSPNQSTNESHIFPLNILDNTSNYSHRQILVPLHALEDGQDQVQTLFDIQPCQEVKFITEQVITTDQRSQEKVLLDIQVPQTLQCDKSKVISEITQYRAPLANSINYSLTTDCNKQTIQNYVHIPDRSVLSRAYAVLPSVLQIRHSNVIAPRKTLPSCTRFGPVIGNKKKMQEGTNELDMTSTCNKKPKFILRDENRVITQIDVSDKDKSNWIGLLPLGDENTANVWIYEENSELYIITTDAIPSRKQLMLGYSKKYAQDYGLTGPIKDIETECSMNIKPWWCYECHRALTSSTQLQKHMKAYHEEPSTRKLRRYRCRYCVLTFSRLFTLRRHMARYCKKKMDKSAKDESTETIPEASINSTINADETRVPSDESFQNYSNGLDFPTNLFDTDRMSGLDISGSSRSELFNPYVLEGENVLSNYLEYKNGSLDKPDDTPRSENEKMPEKQKTEAAAVSCPYCNQNIAAGKRRRHVSECPARRFECECKKVFTSKELLARHIFTQHSNEEKAVNKEKNEENKDTNTDIVDDPTPYKCEQCQLCFKRRGMLINHLWQKHGTVSARVPLKRRVRHYPCVACPKVYRAATKRNLHVQRHHPGLDSVVAWSIEGGTREYSPASCPACPRQYATRAKMLQHMRQHHTTVATP